MDLLGRWYLPAMRFESFGPPGHDSAGWVCYSTETPGLYAFARLAEDARGQLVVRDVLVSSEEHMRAIDLQGVKIGQIEREVNAWPDWMRAMFLKPPPERDAFVEALRVGMTLKREPLRSQPEGADRPKLTRPDKSDPEAFYKLVARAHREVSAQTGRPAPVLAEEAGVPVATVRRWIAEARRRGHLAPGRSA